MIFNLILLLILLLILSLILLLLNLFFNRLKINNLNKFSSFECGFERFKIIQSNFNIHFFVILIIFILFDLEIVILIHLLFYKVNIHFFVILIIFISFLFVTWWIE